MWLRSNQRPAGNYPEALSSEDSGEFSPTISFVIMPRCILFCQGHDLTGSFADLLGNRAVLWKWRACSNHCNCCGGLPADCLYPAMNLWLPVDNSPVYKSQLIASVNTEANIMGSVRFSWMPAYADLYPLVWTMMQSGQN